MSIIDRIKAKWQEWDERWWTGSDSSDTATIRVTPVFQTTAGVRVNGDEALRNATVWACVTYLSRTIAQLPWRVMQEQANGTARRAPVHPIDYVIARRPNPEMSSFTFRETMVGWAVRRGNAVAEIQRDARGIPVALWPIHPSRVTFERDMETGQLLYGVTNGQEPKVYLTGDQVFHLRGYGEGPVGLDVVSYAAESIGWAMATELFGASFFGNGANASGFLVATGKLSPTAFTNLEKTLASKHGGPKKGNKTMILDNGMKYEKSGTTPDDAQFIETRQHQVEEICRWFGVPPHKVMHLLRATFSNIEHQSIEVVVDSITPWAKRLEEEADYKFFGQNRQAFFTKIDLKGLLRGDFKSRQEGLQIMRRNGVVNANEWRRLEDMDEIGPDGDKYICEGNMTTLEAIGTAPVAQQKSPGDQQVDHPDSEADSPVQRARKQAARALLH